MARLSVVKSYLLANVTNGCLSAAMSQIARPQQNTSINGVVAGMISGRISRSQANPDKMPASGCAALLDVAKDITPSVYLGAEP